jgi:hypothetical protein
VAAIDGNAILEAASNAQFFNTQYDLFQEKNSLLGC